MSSLPIDQSADLLGNAVAYGVYEELPGDVLNTEGQWRCEPQPVSTAVVNFYLDLRTLTGTGQVIDRFYVDPTHLGVHCSLYWCNDLPGLGHYQATDNPVPSLAAKTVGNLTPTSQGLQFALDNPAYVDVSNGVLQWGPALDWWVGLSWTSFATAAATVVPLIDLGGTKLIYNGATSTLSLIPANGEAGPHLSVSIPARTQISVVAGWSATGGSDFAQPVGPHGIYILQVQVGTHSIVTTAVASSAVQTMPTPTIRIGGTLDGSVAATGGMLLGTLILKNETPTAAAIGAFMTSPSEYALKGRFRSQAVGGSTDNSYLRFDPSFFSLTNLVGLVGGSPNFMASLIWNPIPREYIMTKGYMTVPPTLARFWKFEMTNLVAEPFEGYLPESKVVQLFPQTAVTSSAVTSSSGYLGDVAPGVSTMVGLAGGQIYSLSSTTNNAPQPPVPSTSFLPTEALVVDDPVSAAAAAAQSPHYNYADHHQGIVAPRSIYPGPNQYVAVDIPFTTKVGFFCGFFNLAAYRTAFQAIDDSDTYIERFMDTLHLASSGWTLNPGSLSTAGVPSGGSIQVVSVVYSSNHNVVGVQFATQQSDPVQIITDDDMRAASLVGRDWTNTDSWNAQGDASLSYVASVNSIAVNRSSAGSQIQFTASGTPHGLMHPPIQPVLRTTSLSTGQIQQASSTFGGLASGLAATTGVSTTIDALSAGTSLPQSTINVVTTQNFPSSGKVTVISSLGPQLVSYTGITAGSLIGCTGGLGGLAIGGVVTLPLGRLWACVRFTPITDLTSPLFLQILDGATGNIMVEWEITGSVGQQVEATYPYDVGTASPAGQPVRVALIQYGKSDDSWVVDTMSIFDESLVWEFSVDGGVTWWQSLDTRNNASGVLSFSQPGNQLVWRATSFRSGQHINSLKIKPLYQGVLSANPPGILRGPNLSQFDHNPPVWEDPEFNVWPYAVPRWWFIAFKNYPSLFPDGVPIVNQFSSFFFRPASEDLSGTFTDVARRVIIKGGLTADTLAGTFVDTVARSNGIFHRTVPDDLSISFADSAVGVVFPKPVTSLLIAPPLHQILE